MGKRGFLGMVGGLFGLALSALASPAVAAPAPAPAAESARIVAVGDLHGDFAAWSDIARAAGLVDPAGHWAGRRTTLVQLGDLADRGPDSLRIIHSLQQLAAEAPAAGGRVVVLLGNHEAMNLLGDLRYTSPGEFAAFADRQSVARREQLYARLRPQLEAASPLLKPSAVRDRWLKQTPLGWAEHRQAWSPSGALGQWAAHNPAAIKIGDTLFAHGGLSAEYARLSLDEINRRSAAAMASADDSQKSILNDPLGPLWYRGLVMADADANSRRARAPLEPAAELTQVLNAFGAKRLVVGHTPSLDGIAITYGGRLIRIDTGNSRFYGGPLSWLEIVGDKVTPHVVKRSAQ